MLPDGDSQVESSSHGRRARLPRIWDSSYQRGICGFRSFSSPKRPPALLRAVGLGRA